MANPRQRRKQRSSTHKTVKHSRRAKTLLKKQPPIRGPKALQEAWDKRKTVRQNYATLGLAMSLNPREAGGVERVGASREADREDKEIPHSAASGSQAASGYVPKGYGRIIRDEEGNILSVELADEDDEDDGMASDEECLEEEKITGITPETKEWAILSARNSQENGNEVIRAPERASRSRSVRRFSSNGEVAYLERLLDRYGEDVEGMARDRKLNPRQHTAGDLKRAIRKVGGAKG